MCQFSSQYEMELSLSKALGPLFQAPLAQGGFVFELGGGTRLVDCTHVVDCLTRWGMGEGGSFSAHVD